MPTTDCSKAKNWGPVYFKRSALLGRIKNRICLVRRTAFILALDSPGRTKSMLSRYIFHDLDSSLAKSTRYRLVQFLKQLFARYDSSTAYCFPRAISRWGRWAYLAFFIWLFKLDFGAACTLSNCNIFAFLNIQLLEPLLLLIKWALSLSANFAAHSLSNSLFDFFFALGFDDENGHDLFFFFWRHFYRSKR